MGLAAVTRGRLDSPHRLLIHGTDGVGKSTLGADAPAPIFLGAEDGTRQLDVARFPSLETWQDARDAVATLQADPGGFRTLVIDSVDWLEPFVFAAVCKASNAASIEDVGGGYGKGYAAALDLWRAFLADLERLQATRGINVILIAHSAATPFRNPEGDDFDRYQLKLRPNASGLLREWVDVVAFARFEEYAHKAKGASRAKGVGTGSRIMSFTRTPAYDAKNRIGLPETLPLSWQDYAEAVERARATGSAADPAELLEEINRMAAKGDDALRAQVEQHIHRAGGEAVRLAKLAAWVNTKTGASAQEGTT
jgi:hypothetical protein